MGAVISVQHAASSPEFADDDSAPLQRGLLNVWVGRLSARPDVQARVPQGLEERQTRLDK